MNKTEELTYRIKSEFVLLRHVGECSDKHRIEEEFNKHLREYKDLTGHDFQLEEVTKKLDHGYECD